MSLVPVRFYFARTRLRSILGQIGRPVRAHAGHWRALDCACRHRTLAAGVFPHLSSQPRVVSIVTTILFSLCF